MDSVRIRTSRGFKRNNKPKSKSSEQTRNLIRNRTDSESVCHKGKSDRRDLGLQGTECSLCTAVCSVSLSLLPSVLPKTISSISRH